MIGLVTVAWVTGYFGNDCWDWVSPIMGLKWSEVYIYSMLGFVVITTAIKFRHQHRQHFEEHFVGRFDFHHEHLLLRNCRVFVRRTQLENSRHYGGAQISGLFLHVLFRQTDSGIISMR